MGLTWCRGAYLILALAMVAGITYCWQNRDIPAFGSLQDDAIYALSAQSIHSGNGYRLSHLPGDPAQTKYPPLYPFVLSLAWDWQPEFPASLTLVSALGGLAYLLIVWLSHRLFRLYGFGVPTATLLTAAVAANTTVIYLTPSAMTELPYTAFLLATILLGETATEKSARWAFAAGVMAGLAYLTRTAALPLVIVIPGILIWRGLRRHALAFLAGAGPAIVCWQIWLTSHPVKTGDWVMLFYTDYLGLERATISWNNIGQILYINLDTLLTGFGNLVIFMSGTSWVGHQAGRLIAFTAILGIWRLSRRNHKWQYSAYALAYSLLLLIWHYPPNERFSVPLVPLILAGLWTEANHIVELAVFTWKRRPSISNRIAAILSGSVVAVFALFFIVTLIEARILDLPAAARVARARTNELRKTFVEIKRRTSSDAVILSDSDGLLFLYTSRKSYRTVVPPGFLYPVDNTKVRDWIASMPDAAGKPWTHALVTRWDWTHTLDDANRSIVRQSLESRADLAVVYKDEFATLYQRILIP